MKKIKFPFDIDDLLVIVGMAGVFIGIWLIYHPAAYIIGGATINWDSFMLNRVYNPVLNFYHFEIIEHPNGSVGIANSDRHRGYLCFYKEGGVGCY